MNSIFWTSKGFTRVVRAWRMVLLLLAVNLVFSLVLAVPVYRSLKGSFGNSLVGDRMAEGFDYLWWEEYRDQARGLEKTFTPSIIGKGAVLNNLEGLARFQVFDSPPELTAFLALYILLHTFLAGGILTVFKQGGPRFTMGEFFSGAGAHFVRFAGLAFFSWGIFLLVGSGLRGALAAVLEKVEAEAYSELTPFILGLIFDAAVLFLLLFIQMVFDYARIKVVVEERRNVAAAAAGAARFVFRNLGPALALFFLLLSAQILVTLLHILLQGSIPQATSAGVLAGFLLQQFFIFALIGIRCWLYAGQLELFRGLG